MLYFMEGVFVHIVKRRPIGTTTTKNTGANFAFRPMHYRFTLQQMVFHLSLVSGRNPDYLIGRHVEAAVYLDELVLTSYQPHTFLLMGQGVNNGFITNTTPIPSDKVDIAQATALAGVQLGMKAIYLEAGSGQITQCLSTW